MKTSSCVIFLLLVILYNTIVVHAMFFWLGTKLMEGQLQPNVNQGEKAQMDIILRQRERIHELEQELGKRDQQLGEANAIIHELQALRLGPGGNGIRTSMDGALRVNFGPTSHLSNSGLAHLSAVSRGMNEISKIKFRRRARLISIMAKGLITSLENVNVDINSVNQKTDESESLIQWLQRVQGIHRKLLERHALTVLYDNNNGINWRRKDNWKTDPDICKWKGVICTGGSVTILALFNNNLSGQIPTEIGQLTNLNWLNLRNNQLSGSIPKEIGLLRNLESLILACNQLTGPIPKEIGQLRKLKVLYLEENELSGEIPEEISLNVLRVTM
eukprot:GSMAST32.ASY1.ANO1.976.1 assembled CDS